MNHSQLRSLHPRFVYQSFTVDQQPQQIIIRHQFLLEPDISFQTYVSIPVGQQIHAENLNLFAFHLGLVEMISYWKSSCSPEIIIEAGQLPEEQLAWWKKLLMNGLGEFFFTNNIDFSREDFLTLKCSDDVKNLTLVNESDVENSGNLLMTSGGKDSAVLLEVLKNEQTNSQVVMVNPTQAALDQADIAGYQQPIIVERRIDPKLLELNHKGYLNGHTPFSAYLAFLGTTVASLYGKKYVIVANEKSASEPNTEFHEMPINHQYSKSYQFESEFREYCQHYLPLGSEYFSLLRPIYDLQVGQIFSQLTQFHTVFRSCNVGQKTNDWCGTCPKCAFVYLALFPFLTSEQVQQIFGSDYFQHPEIIAHLHSLVGNTDQKPFECVGTYDESKLAVALTAAKYRKANQPLPLIIEELENTLQVHNEQTVEQLKKNILNQWSDEHFVPTEFENILNKSLNTNH